MKKLNFVVLVLLFGMFLPACSSDILSVAERLDGSSWKLVFLGKDQAIDVASITASFSEDQISGSAGCNSYFGSYQVQGDQITFDQMGSTLMFCADPEGVMDQEQNFLASLSETHTFELENGQLKIFLSDGGALIFTQQS